MQIFGVGVDIASVDRIKRLLAVDGVCPTVFTEREIAYCQKRTANSHQHFAARFAAKEAVLKALGTGLRGGINWTDIEIVSEGSGRPAVRLDGVAMQVASEANIDRILVSLSHCEQYAVAQAVAVQLASQQENGILLRRVPGEAQRQPGTGRPWCQTKEDAG